MARIELAPEFGDDMDRMADHVLLNEVTGIELRLNGIVVAIEVLRANPLIGRPMGSEMRALVIGRGSRGYVALYQKMVSGTINRNLKCTLTPVSDARIEAHDRGEIESVPAEDIFAKYKAD